MALIRILVLCAVEPAEPMRRCTGQSRFLGEAGLEMIRRGVDVVCAAPGATVGYRPVVGAWQTVEVEGIDAVYDRDHGPGRSVQRDWERRGVPVGNPPSFSEMCDDKLAFFRYACERGLPVPPTVDAADDSWKSWRAAFAKPRQGRMGRGVRLLGDGEQPRRGVVQQAVQPTIAGQCLRLLMQRGADGDWSLTGIIDRRAPHGAPVASLSAGARARSADPEALAALEPLVGRMFEALDAHPDAPRIVEVGADVIPAATGPALIEWNARPGRSLERIGRPDLRKRAQTAPFEALVAVLS